MLLLPYSAQNSASRIHTGIEAGLMMIPILHKMIEKATTGNFNREFPWLSYLCVCAFYRAFWSVSDNTNDQSHHKLACEGAISKWRKENFLFINYYGLEVLF